MINTRIGTIASSINLNSVPADPSNVVTTWGRGNVGSSWTDNATNEDNYEVQYQKNSGGWTAFSDSPYAANTTSASDLLTATSGDFIETRVRATNGAGNSNWVSNGIFIPS